MARSALRAGALALLALVAALHSARAGGTLDAIDFGAASALAQTDGLQAVPVIPIRSDPRCIPVPYSLNVTQAMLANPLGEPVLGIEQARAALEASMAEWRRIPISFIDMRITGESRNSGPSGFDFVNELTFIVDPDMPGGFLGVSPSMTLMQRTELTVGMDLDGDGDSDVAAGIQTCTDVDGDGDIEFPAGTYEAGTILDNDIIFNVNEVRFTTADGDIDAEPRSVDLQAVATHEFGHSHGLSHSPLNQRSAQDGRGALMFPFIDTADPISERASRAPDSDGILVSAELYPEGSRAQGVAALQRGDVRPAAVLGEIRGRVQTADGTPVAGANVFCRDAASGRIAGSTFAGQIQLGLDPASGEIDVLEGFDSVTTGEFRLRLPPGRYQCGVEPVDGSPVIPDAVNLLTIVADVLGQTSFAEEFFNGAGEAAIEASPGAAQTLRVRAGRRTDGVRFIVAPELNLAGALERGEAMRAIAGDPGVITAVVIPGVWLLEMEKAVQAELGAQAGLALQRAEFRSVAPLNSQVPRFESVSLNRCNLGVNPTTQNIDLDVDMRRPLRSQRGFVGQDDDFSPLFLTRGGELGREVLAGLRSGAFRDLCLVLEYPRTPGAPLPALIVDSDLSPQRALSFRSTDGGASFERLRENLQFSLGIVPRGE